MTPAELLRKIQEDYEREVARLKTLDLDDRRLDQLKSKHRKAKRRKLAGSSGVR